MINRRKFLIGSGVIGGGLVLALALRKDPPVPGLLSDSFKPNAFLQITADNKVIFQASKSEMGQGIFTGLATMVGEELDIHPAKIIIEAAGVHPAFAIAPFGQTTGGSTSIAKTWEPIRQAGASARAMLIAAAAEKWQVDIKDVSTSDGVLKNSQTNETLVYGDVANIAATLPVPESAELKSTPDFRYIGKYNQRLDARSKSNGTAEFGIDVHLPGMKTALVKRSPHFGGEVKSFQADTVLGLDGVVDVLEIFSGVAVVADSYWQAHKALQALEVEWDKGPLAGLDSEQILAAQKDAMKNGKEKVKHEEGDATKVLSESSNKIVAEYYLPFYHHSPLEPQNTTVLISEDQTEVWSPNQAPDLVQVAVSFYGGVSKDNITVHSTFMGGGFGRRAIPDFAGEAAAIARKHQNIPIKLMWSREDDMRHDYYRPSSLHRLEGAVGDQQNVDAWSHKIVSQSVLRDMGKFMAYGLLPEITPDGLTNAAGKGMGGILNKVAPTITEGTERPYLLKNFKVSRVRYDTGIPTAFWRSVGHSHNGFAVESFMDELAHAAKADPLSFRLAHMQDFPRDLGVIELVANKAEWGKRPNQGIAVHPSFKSYIAMVAEVSVDGNAFSVDRIVAAVDCGQVVNPDIVRAQIEGGVIYGLSAALKAPITIADGAVVESNFHDLPVMRMSEAPKVEVHLVASNASPTGVGEIGVPPVAAAVANAIFAATGKRLRSLPLELENA